MNHLVHSGYIGAELINVLRLAYGLTLASEACTCNVIAGTAVVLMCWEY